MTCYSLHLGCKAPFLNQLPSAGSGSHLYISVKKAKHRIYIDGHERPDVIKERKEFLNKLDTYEQYVHAFNIG